jgi:hypothetical protein
MRFARWVFLIAGIYGLLVITPGFFVEHLQGRLAPPPINHPEFYYGFFGAALAWQLAFLVIATDPARYRPLMLVGVVEKLAFLPANLVLHAIGRMAASGVYYASMLDAVWAVLFLVAWFRTRPATK